MSDYQMGWREALRVLRREVDAHPSWGAGDIYERISELTEAGTKSVKPVLSLPVSLDAFVELAKRVDKLDGRCMLIEKGRDGNIVPRIQRLENAVDSPDAPNRALVSVVARVEQLEKNGSSDAESINELSRKLGLISDVLTGKL